MHRLMITGECVVCTRKDVGDMKSNEKRLMLSL